MIPTGTYNLRNSYSSTQRLGFSLEFSFFNAKTSGTHPKVPARARAGTSSLRLRKTRLRTAAQQTLLVSFWCFDQK